MNEQPKDNRLKDNTVIHGFLSKPKLKNTNTGLEIFEGSLRKPRHDKKKNDWINGWLDLVAFGSVAIELSRVPEKTLIQITESKIDLNPYIDKNGNKAQKIKCLVHKFYIVEKTKGCEPVIKSDQEFPFDKAPTIDNDDSGNIPF